MCVVSMIGDHAKEVWPKRYPWFGQPYLPQGIAPDVSPRAPSQAEFDQLKREVENLKELLIRAKKYDEQNDEPACEMEDKVKFLRMVAESVGVNLDEVFKKDA